MILKPVEHVLPFDLPILAELSRDLLDLLSVRCPHPSPIQHFQDPDLLLSRVPPGPSRVRFCLHSSQPINQEAQDQTQKKKRVALLGRMTANIRLWSLPNNNNKRERERETMKWRNNGIHVSDSIWLDQGFDDDDDDEDVFYLGLS